MRFIVALLLILTLSIPMHAEKEPPRVNITIRQFVFNAPAHIPLILVVERHPDNRKMFLEWESTSGLRGSTLFQIDGEKAKRTFQHVAKRVPAGRWTFKATLVDNMDKKYVIRSQQIRVMGPGESLHDEEDSAPW